MSAQHWNSRKWVRARDGVYEFRDGFEVLAIVERHDHPMNGHFALWTTSLTRTHFPTMRDAKLFVERQLAPPLPPWLT